MKHYLQSKFFKLLLLAIAFTLSYIEQLPAINHYFEGDTLYVWAEGGLIIRDTNSISGKRIAVIPYGDKIEVLGSTLYSLPSDSIKFIEPWQDAFQQQYTGYYLKGRWVRIKFQGIYGYVFDGYLSHFPAPHRGEYGYYEHLTLYLERVFGELNQHYQTGKEYELKEKYYGQGVSFKNIGTKTAYVKIVFPNLSIQEVLVFIKNSKMASENDQPMLIESHKTPFSETLKFKYYENGDGFLYLHEVGNTVILESISWC